MGGPTSIPCEELLYPMLNPNGPEPVPVNAAVIALELLSLGSVEHGPSSKAEAQRRDCG